MMNNKVNEDAQLKRMKALMNYGINESKQPEYSNVEYGKVAADGKLYGIVREGTNYFIKVAKNPKGGLISENFDYINGFRNRNDNKFDSFASAQRYFCEKLSCINEETDNVQKRVIAEAWNLEGKKEVIEEQTKKVQNEIARQRQIMENAVRIMEGKAQKCGDGKCKKCGSDPCKCNDMEDCPKPEKMKAEEVKGGPGAPFTVSLKNSDLTDSEKTNITGGKKSPVVESAEVPLSSRKNPDYMDMSQGTEIGSNNPFVEDVDDTESDESLHEGASMIDNGYNQNIPTPGVDGEDDEDSDPFKETVVIKETLDDLDDDLEDDTDIDDDIDDGLEDDMDVDDGDTDIDDEGDDEEIDVDVEGGDGDVEYEYEMSDEGDLTSRIDSLETKLDSILDAINNMKYDDDEELYDDDDEEDDFDDDDDFDDEDIDDDEDVTVVESRSYRAMKNKKLNEEQYFGKHPAYHKKVMTLPKNDNFKRDGQYDMNDDSVDGEQPYGISKGNQKPYDQSIESIENAIVESVYKILKKKLK